MAEPAPAPAPTPRRYRVLNPRGIPATSSAGERIHILRFKRGELDVRFYEDDVIEDVPAGFDLPRFLAGGFLEEVTTDG